MSLLESKSLLTVLGLEYLNVCGLDLADGLLVGASDFEDVFGASAIGALVLRVLFETGSFALFSAIALRLGGILYCCIIVEWA